MNHGLWIAKKHVLIGLIKKVSDGYGGDDVEWLKDYCREVLEAHPDEKIDEAIACFRSLYVPQGTRR
jgi:hypothetical protein